MHSVSESDSNSSTPYGLVSLAALLTIVLMGTAVQRSLQHLGDALDNLVLTSEAAGLLSRDSSF